MKFYFKPRFSKKDRAHFINRLSFLLKASIPVYQSLEIIKKQTVQKRKILLYGRVIEKLKGGHPLSISLEEIPIDDFSLKVIRVGESGGFLEENLIYLAKHLEDKKELFRKIVNALIYPIIIALVTLSITVFLVLYVFPKVLPVLLSLNIDLPLSTRVVIALSSFIQNFWIIILSLVVFLILASTLLFKLNYKFRLLSYRIPLLVPIFNRPYKDFLLANFSRTSGLLLNAGITVDKMLETSAETIPNPLWRLQISKLVPKLRRGQSLSECFLSCPKIFPETFTDMIMVAEKTGALSQTLIYLSDYYEKDLDQKLKNFSHIAEPALMIAAGIIVGFVAISIITPVYEITQNLQQR